MNRSKKRGLGLALLLFMLAAAYPFGQPPALDAPEAMGAYLNGVFPSKLPADWQWETAYANTNMKNVITVRKVPGTQQMAFASVDGRIWLFDFEQVNPSPILLGDIAPDYNFPNNRYGLKGIAFHPEYGQAGSPNREFIYIAYMTSETNRRLSRFRVPQSTGSLDLSSELVMIQQIVPGGSYHNIGELAFGHDGYLYVPFGDGHGGSFGPYAGTDIARNIMDSVQSIHSNLVGGLMRIDVDQDASRGHPPRKVLPQAFPEEISGVGYYIPNDNPWLATDGSIMEEYYSLGHRQPWQLSIDELDGTPWLAEVGPHNGEEINRIRKGHNYGWPYRVGATGEITWDRTPPTAPEPNPYRGTLTGPVFSPARDAAKSLGLGGIYRGSKWLELYGKVYCFDVSKRAFWLLDYNSTTGETQVESLPTLPSQTYAAFTSPQGDIMIARTNGTISRLAQGSAQSATLPNLLSETGAFSDLTSLSPAPGFISYTVNTPLWSDRAEKARWIALPNDGVVDSREEQIKFSANSPWEFPEGTVMVKHFELPLDENDPTRTKRLETRFVVIGELGRAYGVTYKWNETGTEATLLADGLDENISITDANGQTYTQTWHYPSRNECLNCHNVNAGQVLGIKTQQLNGDFTYPSGIRDNQLHAWNQLHLFDQDIGTPTQYVYNVPLDDSKATQSFKVRSYLDANCSYCHQPGGVDGAFDARLTTPLTAQGLINQATISAASENSMVVVPGDTTHSELWVRDNSVGDIAMPPLAKNLVHLEYMQVLSDWIVGLQNPSSDVLGEVGSIAIDQNWARINFGQHYNDPILVAGAPTFNDSQAITVRVKNLSPSGCEIRLDAWECQPQAHKRETVNYMVMEAGTHTLANGKKIQAGKVQADLSTQLHPFPETFAETPAVLAQVITENEAVAVISRLDHRQSDARQFQFRLQEQEGSDGVHALETVCWIAAEPGSFDGYLPFEIKRLPRHVEEYWTAIDFEQDYETAPLFLGHISSNYGGDVCALRYREPQGASVEIFLEEEQCRDQETGHYLEDVHYFAFRGAGLILGEKAAQLPAVFGEVGSVAIDHNWAIIPFQNEYQDPVFVAGGASYNGSQPLTVRVRNLGGTSCEIRLDEWECLDETHLVETVNFMVMEAGVYKLANGKKIQAGRVEADLTSQLHPFPAVFTETPAVLAQVVTENEAVAVISRLDHRQTNTNQFQFRLQEQEGSDGVHAQETVCWIAAEAGKHGGALPFEIKRLPRHVEEFWTAVNFEQDYGAAPLFLGHISSNYGGDVCALRYRQTTSSSVQVFLEEEQCQDPETGHLLEDIHYFAFANPGLLRLEEEVPSPTPTLQLASSRLFAPDPSESLSLYPNPVHYGGNFMLEWYEESLGQANIQVFNEDGELVLEMSKMVQAGINRWEVPSTNLRKGLYTLQLLSLKGLFKKKMLVN